MFNGFQGMRMLKSRGRGRGARGRNRPARRNNLPRNRNGFVPRGATFRGRGRLVHTNRHLHVVPPASFTRSSIGREMETITVKTNYAVSDIEIYDNVMSAWSSGNNTTKSCVTRVYVNKSAMAADLSGATPVAATSKRTITHVTGVRIQGHSTIVSTILAGGKKIYNANFTTQRNVNLKQVESRHQIGKYHTAPLHLPGKADMINQKGYRLIKQTITGMGTLEFDYGHVVDFMTSVSNHDLTAGNLCSIDFSANVHSIPNPGYMPDSADPSKYASPPDFVFIRSKDPSLLLQGFNESTEETNVMSKSQKEMEIFSLGDNKYLARTNLVNLLPKPKREGIYRLPQPLRLSKSNNVIAALTLAVYFDNPLDPQEGPKIYFFENLLDYLDNANSGSVSRALINIPSGTVMVPRPQVAPYTVKVTDEKGNEFKPGGKYMVLELQNGEAVKDDEEEEELEDSDSEISIITESLRSVKIPPEIKKRKDRENREMSREMRYKG